MTVFITIPVARAAALVTAGHTKIEVWAATGIYEDYHAITAPTAVAAKEYSLGAATKFNMGGRLLVFKQNNGDDISVSFSSLVTQWTASQVVTRINQVLASAASVETIAGKEYVVLTSPTTGRASSIEIVYSDSPNLGFTAGTVVYGTDAHISLVNTTLLYQYTDAAGSKDYRYKWRFSANGSSPVSEFSSYISGSDPPLSGVGISFGTALFIDITGKPMKAKVMVASDRNPSALGGYTVGANTTLSFEADVDGFLAIPLVKGTVVRVGIDNTSLVREITVPDEDSFDLLSALATATDPYTVAIPTPFLTRRSL